MTPVIGIVLVVVSIVGLGVVLLGVKGASVAQRRFGDELRARRDELGAQDSDPKTHPPAETAPATAAAITVTPVARYNDVVQVLKTLSSPVLAILRARVCGDLEPVKPYLVPSLYQRLNGQARGAPAARYQLFQWEGASIPEVQALRIGLTTKGSNEKWTIARSRNTIQCRSCSASVSGAIGDKCPTCGTSCTGFEAGWRVLDMAVA